MGKRFHDVNSCFWFNRWFTFAASFVTLLCGGTAYLYGTYSNHVKIALNLDQSASSLLGVSFYFSQAGGIFVGLAADYFGPRPVGWFSTGLIVLGYALFRAGILHNYPVAILSLALVLVGLGSGGTYVATVPANINNFHIKHKGKVVGLLVATYGAASAIFSVFYKMFQTQKENPAPEELMPGLDRFFIFLTAFLGVGSFVGILFINFVPKDIDREEKFEEERKLVNEPSATETTDLLHNHIDSEELAHQAYPQKAWYQTLLSFEFILLELAFTILVGAGAVYIATCSQLVASLGIDPTVSTTCVVLISVFNGLSRFTTGVISDLLARKLTRPFFLAFIAILFAATHGWLSIAGESWQLYIASCLIGFCYGSTYVLGPVMINELFGATNWAANNSMLNMLPAGGNLLFTVVIQAHIYSMHTKEGSKFCYGKDCFRGTFYIMSSCCMAAAILSIVLWAKTRRLYSLKRQAITMGIKR